MGIRRALSMRFHPPDRGPEAIRRNMLATAEYFHSCGVDSRIPFLKLAVCDEEVPGGSTARREDGIDVPDWKEGRLVEKPLNHEVVRFNIFNAPFGMQALPYTLFEEQGPAYVKVIGCRTTWMGDLRVSVTDDPGVQVGSNALYNPHFHHILMRGNAESRKSVLAHEIEHARHSSLLLLALGTPDAISRRTGESLAMLAEILYCGHFPQIEIAMRRWPSMLSNARMAPHLYATFDFIAGLAFRHGIRVRELAAIYPDTKPGRNLSGQTLESLNKIWHCAKADYDHIYEKEFGISRVELAAIVAELPMI